jgi:hypothetical protein
MEADIVVSASVQVIAESYLPLLHNVLQHDLDELAAAALSAMLDFLLIFRDSAPWNTPPTSFATPKSADAAPLPCLFSTAFSALGHSSPAVRGVAAEGVAKLLTAGRLRGAAAAEGEALAAAVLLHFVEDGADGGETAKESVAMQQCLAVFLAGFCARQPSNYAVVARAVVPAVRHAMHAPAASRLARVGATHLGQYLLSLLEPGEPAAGAPQELVAAAAADAAYGAAARELLLELEASADDAAASRHLAKILHAIPLEALAAGRTGGYAGVLGLAGRVLGGVRDAATRTALSKFIQAVGEAAGPSESEDAPAPAPSEALPPPVAEEEHEEAVRGAVHGPVAALFTPPGAAVATPARARKASAGGTARKKKAAPAATAASPSDGEGSSLRRSGRWVPASSASPCLPRFGMGIG